jgi:hypothetical protein
MPELLAHGLAGVNAFLGLIVAVLQFQCFQRIYKQPWGWINGLLMLIGFYWFAFYTWAMVTPEAVYDAGAIGQTYVRPAFTVTLLAVGLWSLRTNRSNGGCR